MFKDKITQWIMAICAIGTTWVAISQFNASSKSIENIEQESSNSTSHENEKSTQTDNFLAVAKEINGRYGFIDRKGNPVIPFVYDEAGSFSEGLAAVNQNGKSGYIDKDNQLIIPMHYDGAGSFSEGLAIVLKNGLFGFINYKGKEVIPCIHKNVSSFSNGLAEIKDEVSNLSGYIDQTGDTVIPIQFTRAWRFVDGFAVVRKLATSGRRKSTRKMFIDKSGGIVFPNYEPDLARFSEGFAPVVRKEDDVSCLINTDGVEVLPGFDNYSYFENGLTDVEKNGRIILIDKKGSQVLDLGPSESESYPWLFFEGYSEGRILIGQDWYDYDKYGFLDRSGNQVIPYQYDQARVFSGGLAAVSIADSWGFINKKGEVIIYLKYASVGNFVEME